MMPDLAQYAGTVLGAYGVTLALIALLIGALRLGSLANFISPAALFGFTSGAAVLIAVAGVWLAAVAPAFHTLRQFETTRATQEAQLHTMRALQAQAQTLQAQPHVSASAASQAGRPP